MCVFVRVCGDGGGGGGMPVKIFFLKIASVFLSMLQISKCILDYF